MTVRDMLLQVDAGRASQSRVEAACALALRTGAHLTGLYVIQLPDVPSYAAAYVPRECIEAQRRDAEQQAERAHEAFQVAAQASGLQAEWRCHTGETAETLCHEGLYSDLLVLGQADHEDPWSPGADLADRVVLESGRPVLLIPRVGAPPAIGRRVLVAWNAGREAARALDAAIPLLDGAESVRVLTVNPKRGPDSRKPISATGISQRLARHGVAVETESAHGAPREVGEILLGVAREHDVDLLVMGAYGRSRMREIVLGGATAHVLEHTDVPVLLCH
jgi:nucleotide-binding universal stress UspA family protein